MGVSIQEYRRSRVSLQSLAGLAQGYKPRGLVPAPKS